MVQNTRQIEINIPPGVDTGSQLRLQGEGESIGSHGPSGDLYVVLHIRDHPIFQRKGRDLLITKTLTIPQAALGAKIEVETLDGMETLKIPEGTQNGDMFKIKNKGMPQIQGRGNGDLYVQTQVRTPTNLSRKAKKLLEELDSEL